MSDSRYRTETPRIPENNDLTTDQRLMLIEQALSTAQLTLLNHFGSAGYLGICHNASAHPGVSHPHWDWDYLRSVTRLPKVNDEPEYSYDEVALWCSAGGHAMSALDPGQQRVTVDQWDEESQRMKPMRVRACGEHARPVVSTTRPKRELTRAPVEDGKYLVDKETFDAYIKDLEAKNLDTDITE